MAQAPSATFPLPSVQAALAFLPGARSEAEKRELPRVLLAMGAAIGLASGLVSFGIPAFLPSFFTPDCVLHPLIRAVAPQV